MPAAAKRRITDIIPTADMHVALCRRGANPEAHVLLRKSSDPDPSETEKMNALKQMQIVGGFDDATRKYWNGLPEAEASAFLNKTSDDQKAEVAAKGEKPKEETDASKAVTPPPAGGVQKNADGTVTMSLDDLNKAIEESSVVKKLREEVDGFQKGQTDQEITKRLDTEFRGLPMAKDMGVPVLKAVGGLDEPVRKAIEETFKAFADLSRRVGAEFGKAQDPADLRGAEAQLHKQAEDMAKAQNIPLSEAIGKVYALPANAELVSKALAEESPELDAAA